MRHKNIYRIGEYRIAEDEHGLLRWERHCNFGMERSGKCYIFGNILVFGKWNHEESGYLQLEFSELLDKLPAWERTQYYCFASELLDVSTGQNVTSDFLERYMVLRISGFNPPMNANPGICRLGRYQIAIADKGRQGEKPFVYLSAHPVDEKRIAEIEKILQNQRSHKYSYCSSEKLK
jgi:hypothetical protein